MATISLADSVIPKHLHAGVICVRKTVTLADGDEDAGDIIEMIKVPNGAKILDVIVSSDDVDTHGTPTIAFSVGDQGDVDRYITTSAIGTTGGVARMNSAVGADYTYAAIDTIDITFSAAAATFAAGDMILTVLYSMDSAQ